MNKRQLARCQTFKRITGFRDDRPGQFPGDTKVGQEFALVEAAIAEMDAAEAKHSGGRQKSKGGTTAKTALVEVLRLDLRNIARTARAIEEKEKTPGFAESFRVPRSQGVEALLTAGRLFKQNATPVAAKFVAYELAADFLTHLDEAIQAIEAANQQQNTGLGEQTGGTGAKSVAIRKALNAASQLDTIMRNKYGRDPENLRAWRSANHTERAPRREKPAPLPAPTATPPQPAGAAPGRRRFRPAMCCGSGGRVTPITDQRIYQLTAVQWPTPVPGQMRRVTEADRPLLEAWIAAFQREAMGEANPTGIEKAVTRWLTSPSRFLALWGIANHWRWRARPAQHPSAFASARCTRRPLAASAATPARSLPPSHRHRSTRVGASASCSPTSLIPPRTTSISSSATSP